MVYTNSMVHRLRYEAQALVGLLAQPALLILLAIAVVGGVAAYQVRHAYTIDVGGAGDTAYALNFHDALVEDGTGRTFRWSDAYGYIDLPGTGGGVPFTVTLTLNAGRASVPTTIIVNGETFLDETISEGWRTITLSVDQSYAHAVASRDLVIEMRTPGYPRPDLPSQIYGIMLDQVEVSPQGPGFVVPSLIQLVYIALTVLLVYILVGRAFYPIEAPAKYPVPPKPKSRVTYYVSHYFSRKQLLAPLLTALIAAVLLDGALAWVHLPVTAAVGRFSLAGSFVATYLLLIVTEVIARRLVPNARLGARVIAGLVAAAFLVRFGAVNLPGVAIIDLPWHMKWIRELLHGNWQALYFPGQLSSVPREWGLAVLIPKSPLFYFVAAPLALLPWDLETSVKAFACLLDVSLMLFCYGLLARYAPTLGGWRAGLWAAAIYAITPLSYRSLAYGILPTLLAQWLTVAGMTVLLAAASRMLSPAQEAGQAPRRATGLLVLFAFLLAASLVAFPTIAVFNTMVVGLLVLYLLWRKLPRPRRLGWTLAGVTAGAWALALVSYYGQYVSILINTTLPALLDPQSASAQGTASATGDAASAPATVHWTGPFDLLGWTAGYLVSLIPLLAGLLGLAILWWAHSKKATGPGIFGPLLAAWMSILPVFLVANYKIDMIGKHLFYTVFPLSLGAGIFLWSLARRGGAARWFAILATGALAVTALAFWVQRLVQASV